MSSDDTNLNVTQLFMNWVGLASLIVLKKKTIILLIYIEVSCALLRCDDGKATYIYM